MVEATVAQERRDFYVYVIFRPNGAPCYVGKGHGSRWRRHERGSHNLHLRRIYDQYRADLPIVKVREHLYESEAFEAEIALIAALGRQQHGGCLVNLTDGGEGVRGHIKTPEQAERSRAAILRMWTNEEIRARLISERRQRFSTEVGKNHLSAIAKNFWANEEDRAALLARRLAIVSSPEKRAAKSAKSIEVGARPEYKSKQRATQLVVQNGREVQAKRRASNKAKWAEPEYREKVIRLATIGADAPEAKARRAATDRTPETKQRRSVASVKLFSDPTFRAGWIASRWTPERRAEQAEKTRVRNLLRRYTQGERSNDRATSSGAD